MVPLYPFTFSKAFIKHIVVGNTSVGCCIAETVCCVFWSRSSRDSGNQENIFFKDKLHALSSDFRRSWRFFSLCSSPSLNSHTDSIIFLITFRGGSHYEHLVFLIAGLDATLGLWILYSLFIDSWQQWLLLWKLQIMLGKTTRVFWFWQVQFFQLYAETQFLLRDFYWPVFDKGEYGEEF